MPFGIFVNNPSCRDYGREGFATMEGMTRNSDPDAPFREACATAGITLISVTDKFREQIDNPKLYFEIDTHLAAEGQRLFAESLFPRVREAIQSGEKGEGRPGK